MIDFDQDDVKVKRIIKVFVSATIDIIENKGLDDVTVREVAKISGYNPATIYNYFDNSRQLIFFASLNFMKDYFKNIEDIIKIKTDLEKLKLMIANENISSSDIEEKKKKKLEKINRVEC